MISGASEIELKYENQIAELLLKLDDYKRVLNKILELKKYTSLMEYDEEFIKVKDIEKLLEEVE